jgi:hypothetical protein
VFARLFGKFEIPEIIVSLTNRKNLFACYPYGHPPDLYVVLSPTRGATGGDGLWVQPFGDSSSGFIQPMQLAAAQ